MSDSVIRPLGDMVLVKPAPKRTESESGVQIVEYYQPDTVGTVVALGSGVEARQRAVHRFANTLLEVLAEHRNSSGTDEEFGAVTAVLQIILAQRDAYQPEHVCQVGDEVLFATGAGTELQIGSDTYILISENDLEAVLEPV